VSIIHRLICLYYYAVIISSNGTISWNGALCVDEMLEAYMQYEFGICTSINSTISYTNILFCTPIIIIAFDIGKIFGSIPIGTKENHFSVVFDIGRFLFFV
jgi:hypothetical protein